MYMFTYLRNSLYFQETKNGDDEKECKDLKHEALQTIAHIDYPHHLEMTIYSDISPEKIDLSVKANDNDSTVTRVQTTRMIYEQDIRQKMPLINSENNEPRTVIRSDSFVHQEAVLGADHCFLESTSQEDADAVSHSHDKNRSDEEAIKEAIANISQSVYEMENEIERIVKDDHGSRKTPPLPPPRTPPLPLPPPTVLNADSVSDLALSDEEGCESNEDDESQPLGNNTL